MPFARHFWTTGIKVLRTPFISRDAGSEVGIVDYLVFYTFATKSKLENFSCKSSEAFVFLPAFDI